MAIVAPLSKYKVKNFRIYIAVCVIFAAIFAYDGYLSKYKWSYRYDNFYTKHFIDKGNKPDGDMVFNQKAPPCIVGVAVLLGIYLFVIRNKKIVAEDNRLIINDKVSIAYDTIQKIDKTNFNSRGFFVITCKGPDGSEINHKLSDRDYDNLGAILDHVVAKIS